MLNEVSRFIGSKAEKNVKTVDISRIKLNRMVRFSSRVLVLQEVVWHLGWTGHFTSPLKSQDEEIKHESVVLEHKS